MREGWKRLRWLGTLVCALASCRSHIPNLKPPKPPECYSLPAPGDARYNAESVDKIYPKEIMADNYLKQKADQARAGNMGPPGMGMGGMGPGGMGSMGS